MSIIEKIIKLWKRCLSYFQSYGDMTNILAEKEKSKMDELSSVSERFDLEYKNLLKAESELKVVMESYACGENATLSQVDEKFSKLKTHLKAIRKLAFEIKEKKDTDDE